jgi:hypothetical protein
MNLAEMLALHQKEEQMAPPPRTDWDLVDTRLKYSEAARAYDDDLNFLERLELQAMRQEAEKCPQGCNCSTCQYLKTWDRGQNIYCEKRVKDFPDLRCIYLKGHSGNCEMMNTETTVEEESVEAEVTVLPFEDHGEMEKAYNEALELIGRVDDMFSFLSRGKLAQAVKHDRTIMALVDQLAKDVTQFLNDTDKE